MSKKRRGRLGGVGAWIVGGRYGMWIAVGLTGAALLLVVRRDERGNERVDRARHEVNEGQPSPEDGGNRDDRTTVAPKSVGESPAGQDASGVGVEGARMGTNAGPCVVSIAAQPDGRDGKGALRVVVAGDDEWGLTTVEVRSPVARGADEPYHIGPTAMGESFELSDVPSGRKRVCVKRKDLARTVDVEIHDGKKTTAVIGWPAAGTVEGIVRHGRTGPVARARVFFSRDVGDGCRDVCEAETDRDGLYRIAGIPSGKYEVTCGQGRWTNVTVAEGGVTHQDLVFGLVAITGRVLRRDSGTPLGGATITATGQGGSVFRTVAADDSGGFEFLDLPRGEYILRAAYAAFAPVWDEPKDLRVVVPGSTTLFMVPACRVTVTLRDDVGAPLPGLVDVFCTRVGGGGGWDGRLLADAHGQAVVPGLGPGEYVMLVMAHECTRARIVRSVGPGDNEVLVRVQRQVGLAEVVIAGVVRSSGKGIESVSVRCPETDELEVTDGDGRFAFRGERTGRMSLEFAKRGWAFQRRIIGDVATDELETIDVELERGCSLRLEVVREDGSPAQGEAQLICKGVGTDSRVGGLITLDARGQAEYDMMPAGEYVVVVVVGASGESHSGSQRARVPSGGGSVRVVVK